MVAEYVRTKARIKDKDELLCSEKGMVIFANPRAEPQVNQNCNWLRSGA